ncbi:hypothetical protein CSKR_114051 [Clonorchis sinensis]|uniref:Uncharacterized protein n=1 Tax=Clonorchis sinensis TaxID=79923 RepID=A0A8T1M178_CLOSI|nr:hypothetical protein CSKR_114051 [Clonorchis sinensis]
MELHFITLLFLIVATPHRGIAKDHYADCKQQCEEGAGNLEEVLNKLMHTVCLNGCTNGAYELCISVCRQDNKSEEEHLVCAGQCKRTALERCKDDCRFAGKECTN